MLTDFSTIKATTAYWCDIKLSRIDDGNNQSHKFIHINSDTSIYKICIIYLFILFYPGYNRNFNPNSTKQIFRYINLSNEWNSIFRTEIFSNFVLVKLTVHCLPYKTYMGKYYSTILVQYSTTDATVTLFNRSAMIFVLMICPTAYNHLSAS
jgi:hypothetical protein